MCPLQVAVCFCKVQPSPSDIIMTQAHLSDFVKFIAFCRKSVFLLYVFFHWLKKKRTWCIGTWNGRGKAGYPRKLRSFSFFPTERRLQRHVTKIQELPGVKLARTALSRCTLITCKTRLFQDLVKQKGNATVSSLDSVHAKFSECTWAVTERGGASLRSCFLSLSLSVFAVGYRMQFLDHGGCCIGTQTRVFFFFLRLTEFQF